MMDAQRSASRRVSAIAAATMLLVIVCSWTASRAEAPQPRGLLSSPTSVFTSVDAKRVFQGEVEYAAGHEKAFEAHVEALRRLAAKRHDQHESVLSVDEAKDEERVRKLDSRKLPQVFGSRESAAALEMAGDQAARREKKLQASIVQWKKLEDSEHALHEEQIKRARDDKSARKLQAQAQKNADQSVLTSAERLRRETEAAKYAAAKEKEFEAKVAGYRKAEKLKMETQSSSRERLVHQHSKPPAGHDMSSRDSAHGAVGVIARVAVVNKGSSSLDRALRRDAHLGIAAVQQTLDEQARQSEVQRQQDFKRRVEEESKKAHQTDQQSKEAAATALRQLHAQAKARQVDEAAKRIAWLKKRKERQAVAKMLASTRNSEWPSQAS